MKEKEREKLPDNTILVGKKEFPCYMRSIELLMRRQNKRKIILKGRGNNIKKVVDLAEASKNRYLSDLNVIIGPIKVYTSEFKDKEDISRSVSCIEIPLSI